MILQKITFFFIVECLLVRKTKEKLKVPRRTILVISSEPQLFSWEIQSHRDERKLFLRKEI